LGTVLIAVNDAVLADSLRFSLELEGYDARLCDPPPPSSEPGPDRVCLLLDQDVFMRIASRTDADGGVRLNVPTVLMVNQSTQRLVDRAKALGVTRIVEKPLLGGVLFDAIRKVLETNGASRGD
jgi:AmiR/NasT family two-component response regulator